MIVSDFDRREYRFIELENGLQAMLVRGSEPQSPTKPVRSSSLEPERDDTSLPECVKISSESNYSMALGLRKRSIEGVLGFDFAKYIF